jgi:hypothetical protein
MRYGSSCLTMRFSVYLLFILNLAIPVFCFNLSGEDNLKTHAAFPEYSWDTVPVYIHFGKNDGLTDREVRFVAEHSNLVCLEKGHGMNPHGSSEKGIEFDAARLKAVNPGLKVIYYWNTFLDYPMFEAHRVYEQHPEWWLKTLDGSLDKKRGDLKRYDLSKPEVREWWSDEVKKAVVDGSCDGVFADAFPQITSAANIKLWGQEKYDAIQDGLIQTMNLTRQKIGTDNLIMFNGIRNTDTLQFGMEYLAVTDAATIEHFGHFQSSSKESMARDIEATIAAGKLGKMVILKGWPGFNFTQEAIRDIPYETLLDRARKNITFPLACFLVAAQPHAYFCYSWGYREIHGSLDWYEEFDKPLGPPLADATRTGWIYTREFEHCNVSVDLESKEAKIEWH